MLVLITAKGVPPGGYPFTDPRTGMQFGGFGNALIGRVREIIKHRLANPAIWPQHEPQHFALEPVMREVVDPICRKHPSWCMETVPVGPPSANSAVTVQPVSNPACSACGAMDWQTEYCATCGGSKITGYKCKKCGNKRGR